MALALDRFGITKLYPDAPGGVQWYNNWDNGKSRTIKSGGMSTDNVDPFDDMVYLHCPSYAEQQNQMIVGGQGRCTLKGQHPRIYIRKKDLTPCFENVEMTCYSKIVQAYPQGSDPEVGGTTYTVFRLATRSNHHLEYKCICNGMGYNSEYFLGGNCRLRKELMHHGPKLSHYANAAGTHMKYELNTWVGQKFIVKTVNKTVLLETYVDYTNGVNGGKWTKIMSRLDKGDWPITGTELNGIDADMKTCDSKGSACVDKRPAPSGGPYNKVILRKGGCSYLRTDWVKDSVWKNFSVREIAIA